MHWDILLISLVRSAAWLVAAYFMYRGRMNLGAVSSVIACVLSTLFALFNGGVLGAPGDEAYTVTIYVSLLVPTFLAVAAIRLADLRK